MAIEPVYSYQRQAETSSRGGLLLFVLLFFCEAQVIFGETLSINGACPDFIISAVVACGIFRGREQGFWLGLAGGLFQDLASSVGSPLGQQALAKIATGWVFGSLAGSVRRSFVLIPLLFIPMATVMNILILAFLERSTAQLEWSILGAHCLVNCVYGIPIYYFLSLFPGGGEQ